MCSHIRSAVHLRTSLGQSTDSASMQEVLIGIKVDIALNLPDDSSEKPRQLWQISDLCNKLYQSSQKIIYMDKATSFLENAVDLMKEDDGHKPFLCGYLGISLQRHYEQSRDSSYLDRAISAQEDAVSLTPDDHPNKSSYLTNFASSLVRRFERNRDIADIDRAISVHEKAVDLTPEGHITKPLRLNNLGIALRQRSEQTGDLMDLERSISVHQGAVGLTTDDHPEKPSYLSNLGSSLLRRFKQKEDLADVEKAIFVLDKSINLTPDGQAADPVYLNNLGVALRFRFWRTGNFTDVERAITVQQEAVYLTPDGHASKPTYLANLGLVYRSRFERAGDLADIERAISTQEEAISLMPDGHAGKSGYLNNLGNSFQCRFERSGDLIDIDRAIYVQEDAVRLTTDGNPAKSDYLNNLGSSLSYRFRGNWDITDMDRAISVQEEAVRLTPDGNANKPAYVTNLGVSFRHRFEQTKDLEDANRAISVQQSAVHLTPDGHAAKPHYLANLGYSFLCRFTEIEDATDLEGDLNDIDSAISVLKKAVHLTPDGHASKPAWLNYLGNSFERRYRRSKALEDVNSAISAHEEVVRLTPNDHATKPIYLANLGHSYGGRYILTLDDKDNEAKIEQFRLSASSFVGQPLVRLNSALSWARAARLVDAQDCLNGYSTALRILPQFVWLGETISTRHHALASIGEIPSIGQVSIEAAASAIAVGDHRKALEWLEQGRSIVWGQLLDLRTPVDELFDVHPTIAEDIKMTSNALERAGMRDIGDLKEELENLPSLEKAAQDHRRLAEKWEALLREVRSLEGFDDFLQPQKFSKLMTAAKAGPVAIINAHESRCDALILLVELNEIVHVPLEGFSFDRATELHRDLEASISAAGVRSRGERHMGRAPFQKVDNLQRILAELWTGLVKPVLDGLPSMVRIIIYTFLKLISKIPSLENGHLRSSSNLVVCDRSTCFSSHPCCRNIRTRTRWTEYLRLRHFILHTHIDCTGQYASYPVKVVFNATITSCHQPA
jgi:tetratricopeptide (TPR) repeat protein